MPYVLREKIWNASREHGKPNWWDRWAKKSIIPQDVLVDLWEGGFKFLDDQPERGMKLERFLELLKNYYRSIPEGKDRDDVLSLYVDTVQSELTPYWRNKVKSMNGK